MKEVLINNQIMLPIWPADEKIRREYFSFRLYFGQFYFEDATFVKWDNDTKKYIKIEMEAE